MASDKDASSIPQRIIEQLEADPETKRNSARAGPVQSELATIRGTH
jgi:hypothetical protein